MGGMITERKAEKTQLGNPHRLTRKQHVLPVKSIERFSGKDGCVSVLFKEARGGSKRIPPKDRIFWAERVWDQRSEVIMKKTYEDPFQELAERIISGTIQSIGPDDNITATAFWGLWVARFQAKLNPPEDRPVIGCTGIGSKDLREVIEKKHAMFINPDGTLPGRAIAGMDIQKQIDRTLMEFENWNWVIASAEEPEFIVPDCPRFMYIPISPKIGLTANDQKLNGKIKLTRENMAVINKSLFEVSDRYIFGNSLNPDTNTWIQTFYSQ
ncbi:MAG: hypothetical protein ACYCT9_04570 [Leptospirillum sp.]